LIPAYFSGFVNFRLYHALRCVLDGCALPPRLRPCRRIVSPCLSPSNSGVCTPIDGQSALAVTGVETPEGGQRVAAVATTERLEIDPDDAPAQTLGRQRIIPEIALIIPIEKLPGIKSVGVNITSAQES
jgi:hypothetical protein